MVGMLLAFLLGIGCGYQRACETLLRHAILALMRLAPAAEVSGLPLARLLGNEGMHMHVTAVLRDLEDEGLLTHREEPGGPSRGGRPRYWYRLKP